jgi:hypothetical protein
MFNVRAILDHRKKKGKKSNGLIEYKIQWEGQNMPTWEIETYIREDIPDLLDEYLKSLTHQQ